MAVVTKSGCLHHENPSHSPIIFVEADTLPGLPGQAWAYILLSLSIQKYFTFGYGSLKLMHHFQTPCINRIDLI